MPMPIIRPTSKRPMPSSITGPLPHPAGGSVSWLPVQPRRTTGYGGMNTSGSRLHLVHDPHAADRAQEAEEERCGRVIGQHHPNAQRSEDSGRYVESEPPQPTQAAVPLLKIASYCVHYFPPASLMMLLLFRSRSAQLRGSRRAARARNSSFSSSVIGQLNIVKCCRSEVLGSI